MGDKGKCRVTMQDIAREIGVTKNTVSRALMGMPDISATTTEIVRRKADEMGYIRNRMASALRSGSTHTLALIVGYLANPYFAIIYNNVAHMAEKLGYTVILFSSFEKAERELKDIRTALAYHVDGIILFPCQENKESLYVLRASGIPFVILSRACREAGIAEKDTRVIQNLNAQGQDNSAGTAERIAGLYRRGCVLRYDRVPADCPAAAA